MRIDELAAGVPRIVRVAPETLRPDVGDVTRCSCGPQYKPRESVRRAIEELIPVVLADVDPRFSYAVFRVAAAEDDAVQLTDSRLVEIKLGADGPLPAALAAVLCTVGPVDARLEQMIESRGPLDAWIAQGVAMAQLERLEQHAMRHVLAAAAEAGLGATDFIEPDVASPSQRDLFAAVGADELGVRLTEYGTMDPRLSYSFWVPLHLKEDAATT